MRRASRIKRSSISILGVDLLVVTVVIAACGGTTSSQAPTTPASTGPSASTPAEQSPPPAETGGASGGSSSPAPFKACDLLTPTQVAQLLGAAGQASESDYATNYEACQWLTTATGNVSSLRLGVTIKLTPSDNGFAPLPAADSPQPLSGAGDSATYAAMGNDTGFGSKLLVADKGPVSVSLDIEYGGSVRAPASTQANMIAAANAVFSQLGR